GFTETSVNSETGCVGAEGWQPSLECSCLHRAPARSSNSTLCSNSTLSVTQRISLSSPFFHSAQEVLCFNLYLSGDVGIMVVLEHDFPCGDFSRIFGLQTSHH